MYRLWIVEDDMGIAEAIQTQAELWDMQVRCVRNFRNVMAEFADFDPHIVLLDISLPFFNGYHWCSEIRKVSKVPIIFISSASDNLNMVMAMNLGADDFIAKPFDQSVLMAKLQALLRRTYDFGAPQQVLEHRGALLGTGDSTLTYRDEKIQLSKNEFRILSVLLKNKGKAVSREKLMQALWETDSFVDENTLSVNVNRLRKRLAAAGLEDFIATKFGVDPIHFGMVMIMNFALANITPPVGLSTIAGCAITDKHMGIEHTFPYIIHVMLIVAVMVLVIIFVPQISTVLPSIFG